MIRSGHLIRLSLTAAMLSWSCSASLAIKGALDDAAEAAEALARAAREAGENLPNSSAVRRLPDPPAPGIANNPPRKRNIQENYDDVDVDAVPARPAAPKAASTYDDVDPPDPGAAAVPPRRRIIVDDGPAERLPGEAIGSLDDAADLPELPLPQRDAGGGFYDDVDPPDLPDRGHYTDLARPADGSSGLRENPYDDVDVPDAPDNLQELWRLRNAEASSPGGSADLVDSLPMPRVVPVDAADLPVRSPNAGQYTDLPVFDRTNTGDHYGSLTPAEAGLDGSADALPGAGAYVDLDAGLANLGHYDVPVRRIIDPSSSHYEKLTKAALGIPAPPKPPMRRLPTRPIVLARADPGAGAVGGRAMRFDQAGAARIAPRNQPRPARLDAAPPPVPVEAAKAGSEGWSTRKKVAVGLTVSGTVLAGGGFATYVLYKEYQPATDQIDIAVDTLRDLGSGEHTLTLTNHTDSELNVFEVLFSSDKPVASVGAQQQGDVVVKTGDRIRVTLGGELYTEFLVEGDQFMEVE